MVGSGRIRREVESKGTNIDLKQQFKLPSVSQFHDSPQEKIITSVPRALYVA